MRILSLAALTVLAAGTLAGGVALADGKGHFMRKIDTDGDERISMEEATAFQAERFEKLDPNGDGTITLEEWTSLHQARFAAGDSDGDGFVTREEMKAQWKQHRKDGQEGGADN